jgi:probable O-glycosylation ligase (exosortase A-associated)
MRGLLLAAIFFSIVPFVFKFPYLGILIWFWISLMQPHRIVYGFFADLQYALIVAVITLIAWLWSREPKRPPWDRTTVLLVLLMLWVSVSSVFALAPGDTVFDKWDITEKALLFTVLAYATTNTRQRLEWLILVCALSVGFYGLRGGIFTIMKGGADRVYGPPGSMIGDNNDLGVALVMTLPLLFYIWQRYRQPYVKLPMLALIALTFIATLFTYSRGALVAIAVMGTILWFRSRQKLLVGVLIALGAVGVMNFAPPDWFARMSTIETYESDQSAQGRLLFWRTSWAMAMRRPMTGAGYRWLYYPGIVNARLAGSGLPPLDQARAAHSIWFEMIGDHGFVGFGIFVAIIGVALTNARWLQRNSAKKPELLWANQLGRMLQASIIGFCAGGSFASLAMYDGFYILVVITAAARQLLAAQLATAAAQLPNDAGAAAPPKIGPLAPIRRPPVPTGLLPPPRPDRVRTRRR